MTDGGLRVLVTAGSSRLGALVVTALEARDDVSTVIAVDDRAPGAPFARAEFVRLGDGLTQLPRVVRGADVEVVVDVRAAATLSPLDERALTGHGAVTERVASACTEAGSPVRRLVTVGSVHRLGWGSDLPAFLTEEVQPPSTPRGALAVALAEIERAAVAARIRRPELELTTVRLADHVGPAGCGILQAADRLPLLPTVLGFDPRVQVVHEEDAAAAVAHVVGRRLDGPYLVAADGTLALSEALRILGRAHAPVLPPWGTGVLAGVLSRAGLGGAHELAGQLRRGRGIDNRRLKATGFRFRSTSREALQTAAGVRRRRRVLHPGVAAPYEPEVEAFLRYSPSARADPGAETDAADGIGALEGDALIVLLPSLDPEALRALRAHEEAGPARRRVLDEIDLLLQRR
jgi:UDP-glucose 4-epimerase